MTMDEENLLHFFRLRRNHTGQTYGGMEEALDRPPLTVFCRTIFRMGRLEARVGFEPAIEHHSREEGRCAGHSVGGPWATRPSDNSATHSKKRQPVDTLDS